MPAGGGGGGSVFISMIGPGGPGPGGGGARAAVRRHRDRRRVPGQVHQGRCRNRHDGDDANGGLRRRPAVRRRVVQPARHARHRQPARDDAAGRQMALRRSREDLARLLLGIVAGTQPSFAVTYTYAGQAESPDGKADVDRRQRRRQFRRAAVPRRAVAPAADADLRRTRAAHGDADGAGRQVHRRGSPAWWRRAGDPETPQEPSPEEKERAGQGDEGRGSRTRRR